MCHPPELVNAELCLALELADVADRIAMSRFRADDLIVQTKPDGSPVTDADELTERALRGHLAEARPSHAILGEELGASGDSAWCWYLDPIDGTGMFLAGDPHWYSLIALVHLGVPVIGVASAAALGSRWWASRGEGTYRDGRRLQVSTTERLAEATINDDWRGTLARRVPGEPIARLAAHCGHVRPREGHPWLALADGECDVSVGVGGFAWDHAPLKVIVEEAGGRFTDLHGTGAIDIRDALVSNGLLHEEALRILSDCDHE